MKKKTNKKLSLNKERISELSQENMKDVNGGGWKSFKSKIITDCGYLTWVKGCTYTSIATC